MEIFIISFCVWMFCGIVSAMVGAKKGEGCLGFILGMFLGPFGILFALLSKGNRKTCPFCKEMIHQDASVCSHCRSAIEKMLEVRCPTCGERGQVRASLLGDCIECPKCETVFSAPGRSSRSSSPNA